MYSHRNIPKGALSMTMTRTGSLTRLSANIAKHVRVIVVSGLKHVREA